MISRVQSLNLTTIKDFLNNFDGASSDFDITEAAKIPGGNLSVEELLY